jgi:hypothetical protein
MSNPSADGGEDDGNLALDAIFTVRRTSSTVPHTLVPN